jgi:hypothetical protein
MSTSARLIAFSGVVVVVAIGFAWDPALSTTARAQDKGQPPPALQKWEYKIMTEGFAAEAKETEATLKPLGSDGWELVTATHVPLPGGAGSNRYVLKRPKK